MSKLFASSFPCTRFKVEGEKPEDFWDFAAAQIGAFSFKDIDDSYETISAGWVSVVDMLDNEFLGCHYAFGDHIVMSLRIDERKVPAATINKFYLKEERRIKRDRQIPKLSRGQKMEIRESVTLMLMKRAVPDTAQHDLVWNLDKNIVYFISTNNQAKEVLEDIFKQCFDMTITEEVHYTLAEKLVDADLQALTPTIFT
jgi:DNA recombination-dependent growth factor C